MPNWTSAGGSIKPMVVYHGTDDTLPGAAGLSAGSRVPGFRVNLSLCRPHTDFGQGFYATTSLHQARQWANHRSLRTPGTCNALVLRFELDREWLASLETLAFVRLTREFWDLVTDCRFGFAPHQRLPPNNPPFDVVYGPVTLGAQKLVIQDWDQISFHISRAVAGNGLRTAWIHDIGQPTFQGSEQSLMDSHQTDGDEAVGGFYRIIAPGQDLSDNFVEAYWEKVKQVLRNVFRRDQVGADNAVWKLRSDLAGLGRQNQTMFCHADPFEVAADLAGRGAHETTPDEKARYQNLLGQTERPPASHINATHPEDA